MEGGFGSDLGGAGGRKLDLGLIMEQVKVLITVANTQELLQRITDKCFHKCIGKPGAAGQLGAEVPRHVPRPLHGALEHHVTRLQLEATAGAHQHVTLGSWGASQPAWSDGRGQ